MGAYGGAAPGYPTTGAYSVPGSYPTPAMPLMSGVLQMPVPAGYPSPAIPGQPIAASTVTAKLNATSQAVHVYFSVLFKMVG